MWYAPPWGCKYMGLIHHQLIHRLTCPVSAVVCLAIPVTLGQSDEEAIKTIPDRGLAWKERLQIITQKTQTVQ